MADEITSQSFLRVVNGSQTFNVGQNVAITQNSQGGPSPGFWIVGTSEENTTFPDLTNEGWLYMQNQDSTNFVDWGFSTGVYGGRLLAGEDAKFRCKPGVTLYMKADTASCKVVVYCFEA